MIRVFLMALALAQDSARASLPIELFEAYRIARERNPRVAAARALAQATRSRIASSRRPPDPQVQLGFMNYTLPGLRAMDVVGMTQLQAMQMLPIAGKLGLAGRVATASAEAQAERSRDIEWEVRSRVAMAFYDLYVADKSLAVDRETLRLLQDVLRTAEAMYRVGEGRQADVLRAQVEIARMAQDTVRMFAMQQAMAARLGALLDAGAAVGARSALLPDFPDSVPPVDTMIAAAMRTRPMLLAGERELDAAASQLKLTRRDIWPDLTVGVQYAERSGMEGPERMTSLMVGATLPVFATSRQLRMREEATAMQQMARADFAAMRADTRAAVAEAHASLMRARTLAAQYRSTLLPQAEAVVTSAFAAYRVGTVDFMTLLDNRMNVNRYRRELLTLEADEGKAWADLEMLLGRELFAPQNVTAVEGRM